MSKKKFINRRSRKRKYLLFSLLVFILLLGIGFSIFNVNLNINGIIIFEKFGKTKFEKDSLETIIYNVQSGNTSMYHIGDTRTIDLGELGVHILRIANMESPSECLNDNYSQTACGFVIEFADIIMNHRMNSYYEDNEIAGNGNIGGWAYSEARVFLNNDLYRSLPLCLQNAIINTSSMSGQGSSPDENIINTVDKLYLFSGVEIYGTDISSDSLKSGQTRQLDFYSSIGVNQSNVEGAIKQLNGVNSQYWLRSAAFSNLTSFHFVRVAGAVSSAISNSNFGFSPAFRLSGPSLNTSFADDSWETIILNAKTGVTDMYQVGEMKEIDMGSFGNHTLRIVNNSNPKECETLTSKTACGFILEFADIVTTYKMNNTNINVGGWQDSLARTYLNNDIYNALPTLLRDAIIYTDVVSGHGDNSEENNFITMDKLFLLSGREVYGSTHQYDSLGVNDTRQLDYYRIRSVTQTYYSDAIKKENDIAKAWWLRSASFNTSTNFRNVGSTGSHNGSNASYIYGLSPAFRLSSLTNNYSIYFNMNGGNLENDVIDSATLNDIIEINKPTKVFTLTIDNNDQNATVVDDENIPVTMIRRNIDFDGWTADSLRKSTSVYGTDISNISTPWTNEKTKVGANNSVIYMRSLQSAGNEVTLTANWTNTSIKLPKVERLNSICTFNTEPDGTGTSYNSLSNYTVSMDTSSEILYVTCELTCFSNFDCDSWPTIISNIQSGNTERYSVSDTKNIDLGNSFGVHTLRVANNSNYNCEFESKTACGFVLEFADIIVNRGATSSSNGWADNDLRTYVNNDIYNALPLELRNNIIDTYVLSGHGKPNIANYTSTDKLYLLSYVEIYGSDYEYDSVKTSHTRQLDYYLNMSVTSTQYLNAIKKYDNTAAIWWMRSARGGDANVFRLVGSAGYGDYDGNSTDSYGVSPAFRLKG